MAEVRLLPVSPPSVQKACFEGCSNSTVGVCSLKRVILAVFREDFDVCSLRLVFSTAFREIFDVCSLRLVFSTAFREIFADSSLKALIRAAFGEKDAGSLSKAHDFGIVWITLLQLCRKWCFQEPFLHEIALIVYKSGFSSIISTLLCRSVIENRISKHHFDRNMLILYRKHPQPKEKGCLPTSFPKKYLTRLSV